MAAAQPSQEGFDIDGQAIDVTHLFEETLFQHKPSDVIDVVINCGGNEQPIKLTPGERPADT